MNFDNFALDALARNKNLENLSKMRVFIFYTNLQYENRIIH